MIEKKELVKGYSKTSFKGDDLMETLYFQRTNGDVYKSDTHKWDTSFDKKGRTWCKVLENIPEYADWLGHYHLPESVI